jgi:hypothetical protein
MKNLQWVVHAAQVSGAIACREEGCGHAKRKHQEHILDRGQGRYAWSFGGCKVCPCTKFK